MVVVNLIVPKATEDASWKVFDCDVLKYQRVHSSLSFLFDLLAEPV